MPNFLQLAESKFPASSEDQTSVFLSGVSYFIVWPIPVIIYRLELASLKYECYKLLIDCLIIVPHIRFYTAHPWGELMRYGLAIFDISLPPESGLKTHTAKQHTQPNVSESLLLDT
jgi:hypothetical protein